jgi:DNA-binding NtrC family response regulator
MKPKVLAIDDEPNVLFALRRQLSALDCNVLEAGNLGDAKRLLNQYRHEIGVVILDLRLVAVEEKAGKESGLGFLKDELLSTQVCLDCKKLRFNPSVIVLTAYPNVESCRAAFLAGALDYLDKNNASVWEALEERVRYALQQPLESALYESRKWVEGHFEDLLKKYAGQTVAVDGERVVETADSLEELKSKLEMRKLRPDVLLLVTIGDDEYETKYD